MNLDDMLKEASIIDHSWYGNGMLKPGEPTFDAEKEGIRKRNHIIPELEIEFGMAGPDVDPNEPAGVVSRNIPEEALGDANSVIVFARDQMNRGKMGKSLTSALEAKFEAGTLEKASDGLKKLFSLEGIVGCIAVDGRGYKNCREAMKAASHSPYKHFIKHVIGCQCGDPQQMPSSVVSASVDADSKGGSMDGFLASEGAHKAEMVSHCRSTMLPILSWQGDLDPSEVDQTLVELTNTTGLPEGEVKDIWAFAKDRKLSSIQTIQATFRWLNAQNEKGDVKKAAGRPGKSDDIIQMGTLGQEFDVMAPLMANPDVAMVPQMGDVLGFDPMPSDVAEGVDFDEGIADVELEDSVQPLEINMRQEELEI